MARSQNEDSRHQPDVQQEIIKQTPRPQTISRALYTYTTDQRKNQQKKTSNHFNNTLLRKLPAKQATSKLSLDQSTQTRSSDSLSYVIFTITRKKNISACSTACRRPSYKNDSQQKCRHGRGMQAAPHTRLGFGFDM